MRKVVDDMNRKFVRIENENGVELLDNPFGHIYFEKGYWHADSNLCRIVAQSQFEKFDEQIHRYLAKTPEALLTAIQTAINPEPAS